MGLLFPPCFSVSPPQLAFWEAAAKTLNCRELFCEDVTSLYWRHRESTEWFFLGARQVSSAVLEEALSPECRTEVRVCLRSLPFFPQPLSVELASPPLGLLPMVPNPMVTSWLGSHVVNPTPCSVCSVTTSFLRHLFSWPVWAPHCPGSVIPRWTFLLTLHYSSSFTWPLRFRGSWGWVFSCSSVLTADDFICSRSLSLFQHLGCFVPRCAFLERTFSLSMNVWLLLSLGSLGHFFSYFFDPISFSSPS